jgi:hypothetical protein
VLAKGQRDAGAAEGVEGGVQRPLGGGEEVLRGRTHGHESLGARDTLPHGVETLGREADVVDADG